MGSGPLLVMLIQSLKRGDLAFEMVLSGIVTEHGERVGAAEGLFGIDQSSHCCCAFIIILLLL